MCLSGLSANLSVNLVPFPVRAHAWVASQVPSRGRARGNYSFSLSFPFSKNTFFFKGTKEKIVFSWNFWLEMCHMATSSYNKVFALCRLRQRRRELESMLNEPMSLISKIRLDVPFMCFIFFCKWGHQLEYLEFYCIISAGLKCISGYKNAKCVCCLLFFPTLYAAHIH